jgi:2-polyprenyl-6-methoxyphenol hydroxylase-like FAD-dependent oxidoreductase
MEQNVPSGTDTQVLIAGAGPTGLTLALWLRRLGVAFRIIDKDSGPGETSRALAVQARTLEFHRQIGIVDDVLAAGVKIEQIAVRTPAGVAARLQLSAFGAGLSRYPFAFALPQDVHERLLIAHLERAGVQVERNTELVAFSESASGVTATLRRDGATEAVAATYLCGCDGAHSTVRHALKLGFPGGAYAQVFYVADVTGTGQVATHGMDVNLGAYGFGIVMPVRQTGSVRLIGIVPKAHEADATIRFEDIRASVERDTGITVQSVNWFSTYHVHHRVADTFRVGRAFIAGDAGHIHSPAGGQGMNTGMGDAVNLAWKLAAVLQGRAAAKLLDSYAPERIAFAQLLIRSTDQAFRIVTSPSPIVGFLRRYVMPRVMALALRTPKGAHTLFRLVSQIRVNYRDGPISAGAAGEVRGGDRLPYVADGTSDNYAPLGALDWQVHVYGRADAALRTALRPSGIPLHEFAWTPAAEQAGLTQRAIYLIRPDGYIALAAPDQHPEPLVRYLDDLAIRARASA